MQGLNIKTLAIVLSLASLAAAIVAAIYWYRSSRLPYLPFETTPVKAYDEAVASLLAKSGPLNARAAMWTGVASVLGAAASVLGNVG